MSYKPRKALISATTLSISLIDMDLPQQISTTFKAYDSTHKGKRLLLAANKIPSDKALALAIFTSAPIKLLAATIIIEPQNPSPPNQSQFYHLPYQLQHLHLI
ncbi:hypothetical protein ACOSP7_028836 [Xanthoceras sorbifolium]